MPSPQIKTILTSILVFFLFTVTSAQDPFFVHFHSNASHYNPAMVGHQGAFSFNVKYKSQWGLENIDAFKTMHLSVEESLPCTIFDWGLVVNADQEGAGILKTLDLGFKFAGTIPFPIGNSLHNVRLGGSFQWTNKSIDYSKLIFSDELDQKYGFSDKLGNDLISSFVAPNEGRSFTIFTPSLGIVYKGILNESSNTSPSLLAGLSLHNSFSLKQRPFGDIESILRNEAKIPKRWTAFVKGEFVPYLKNSSFFAIRPLLVFQKQSELEYLEFGSSFALNRLLNFGVYYHLNKDSKFEANNNNWFSFTIELGKILGDNNRIDLGFTFTRDFSGLRNIVGSIYEFSFSYHLNRSFTCRTGGKKPQPCPLWEVSRKHRKIYENIWYK